MKKLAIDPIARRSLSDAVFERLSSEIVYGRMQPGSRLPAERVLCEMTGVNRGAIREALKRLEQAGLVAIQHGGATRVLNFRKTGSFDLLDKLLFQQDGTIDLEVARSVMEMRAAIAPDMASLCARKRATELLQDVQRVVERMEQAQTEPEQLQTLVLQFWQLLAQGSGNIAYQLVFNTLLNTYERLSDFLLPVMAAEMSDLDSYQAIAKAIADQDEATAKQLATTLLQHGTRGVFELLAAATDPLE